jgi:hypothetical protein
LTGRAWASSSAAAAASNVLHFWHSMYTWTMWLELRRSR